MSLILKKQVRGNNSHDIFPLFFAVKPAVHAAVTLAFSPMMRGGKVLKKLIFLTYRAAASSLTVIKNS